jgi:hypothetical protein
MGFWEESADFVNIIVHESLHFVINQIMGQDKFIDYYKMSEGMWAVQISKRYDSHFVIQTGMDGFDPERLADGYDKSNKFYQEFVK